MRRLSLNRYRPHTFTRRTSGRTTATWGPPVLRQLYLSGSELEQAAPRRGQRRIASGRALPAHRLHHHNLARPAERVVAFYNQRGTAEQCIKEGKNAIKWTRLSGAALGIGVRQNVVAADLVVQGIEAIAGFCLRFRV